MASSEPAAQPHDEDLSAIVTVLSWGFRAAVTSLLIGLALALIRDQPITDRVEPIRDVLQGIVDGNAAAFVDLGIILFLLTPPAVVATVLVHFLRRHDLLFAAISLIVLLVLASGIVLAFT